MLDIMIFALTLLVWFVCGAGMIASTVFTVLVVRAFMKTREELK